MHLAWDSLCTAFKHHVILIANTIPAQTAHSITTRGPCPLLHAPSDQDFDHYAGSMSIVTRTKCPTPNSLQDTCLRQAHALPCDSSLAMPSRLTYATSAWCLEGPYLLAQDLVECLEASQDDGLVCTLHTAAAQARKVGANANCAPADQGDGEALTPRPASNNHTMMRLNTMSSRVVTNCRTVKRSLCATRV